MNLLLAGGTGMLGRAAALALHQRGHAVTILSRHPARHQAAFPASIQVHSWEPEGSGWQRSLAGKDILINLAGASLASRPWTATRKEVLRASRLHATRSLVQAVQAQPQPPERFLQASAVGFYGNCGEAELTESSPLGDGFLARLCADWENASAPLQDAGVNRIVLRTGIVLSASEGALPRLMLPFRLFAGGKLGDGNQWMPWIHQDDAIRAIVHLVEHPTSKGVYNLTAPAPVPNHEFARQLGTVLHRPAWFPIPAMALRFGLGEMATTLLFSQRALPARLLSEGFSHQFPHLESALEDLL